MFSRCLHHARSAAKPTAPRQRGLYRSFHSHHKSHSHSGPRTGSFPPSAFGANLILVGIPLAAVGVKARSLHQEIKAGGWSSLALHCEAVVRAEDAVAATELKLKGLYDASLDEEGKEEEGDTGRLVWDVIAELGPDWSLILMILAVTTASAAVNIMTPTVIGELVTVVQGITRSGTGNGGDLTSLNKPAVKLLGLFLSQGLLTFVDITLVTRLGENLSLRLRKKLYSAILRQDMAFFDAHMQGEVVGRLTQDVAEFKHTFKMVITQGLKCVAQVIGAAYQLLMISPRLTGTLLTTMPILYLAMNMYGVFLRQVSKLARVGDSKASGVAGEAVSNIRTVRAFASEGKELDNYMAAATSASEMNSQLGFHIGVFQGMTNASIGSMILMILYFGGNLVATGEMTGGQLMTYMVSTQSAQRSLALVGVLFGQVIKAAGSAARVFEYINYKSTIPLNTGFRPPAMKGLVEFHDVSFVYPTRPGQPVLHDFSLQLPVGKVVAVCGPSGSGKSTIGQLVERFYDVDNGSILVDGKDIRTLDPSWLRSNIGYINQEPILFATSILENIRYGRPNATVEEVRQAAAKANAAEFIAGFPEQYNTVVGERGVTLSGGQKQRIAIARAILKDPKILILDEATSALDTQSEKIVQEALEKLMHGRTVLVIAHRLSTIQNADVIVVMGGAAKDGTRGGNIVEKGTHEELMKSRGAYFKLYNRLQEDEGTSKPRIFRLFA